MKRLFILIPTLLLLSFNFPFAQRSVGYVTVEGEVFTPLKLSLKELLLFKASEAKGKDRDGRQHTYKGVMLWDILDSAGVTLGKEPRGENLIKYVVAKADDGYEVVFSLSEIDPAFSDNMILLAYEVDGYPLAAKEGPFRLVVPDEKKHARWIRQLTMVKVLVSKG